MENIKEKVERSRKAAGRGKKRRIVTPEMRLKADLRKSHYSNGDEIYGRDRLNTERRYGRMSPRPSRVSHGYSGM